MGVGRIGRTRARPGSLKSGADTYRRLEMPEQASPRTATAGCRAAGLILVAIITVGYVVGWMRALFFGP
jgi:hypothetical protein